MSPQDREFWLRANRRAASMTPDIQRALLRAFAIIRDSLSESELARIVASGNLERLFIEAMSEQTLDRAFIPYRQRIRSTVESNVKYFSNDLPRGGRVNGVVAVSFDVLNPKTIDAIRTLDTKVVQTLKQDTRETVRAFVENGLRDGKNPKEIGRQIRSIVGMSPTQEANAQKYEAKLRALKEPPTEERIAKQVATYRKKAISLNAETVSRTASLDAMKMGQRLSWEDAAAKGVVDRNRLTKTWRGILDDRERPEHRAMEGQTVPFDSPFSNGQMTPGDTEYNCRCTPIYRVA